MSLRHSTTLNHDKPLKSRKRCSLIKETLWLLANRLNGTLQTVLSCENNALPPPACIIIIIIMILH